MPARPRGLDGAALSTSPHRLIFCLLLRAALPVILLSNLFSLHLRVHRAALAGPLYTILSLSHSFLLSRDEHRVFPIIPPLPAWPFPSSHLDQPSMPSKTPSPSLKYSPSTISSNSRSSISIRRRVSTIVSEFYLRTGGGCSPVGVIEKIIGQSK